MTMRIRSAARTLCADKRAVALIEFALALPPLLILLAIVIDLGRAYHARLVLLRALTAGALYAFEQGSTVTSATATDLRASITTIVQQSADDASLTVTIRLNGQAGSANADGYYCTTGYPVNWTTTGTKSVSCPDHTMSAKFVAIHVSGVFTPLFPFGSIAGSMFPLTETVLVRTK